tara:strand:+ start:83 stop:694 length:612 start_codon:yes stop_codon:yes gene_type:complete
MVNNKDYPIYYVTYYKDKKLPKEVPISKRETKKKGFHIISNPDSYKVPEEIKAYHAGFRHMKERTIEKIESYRKSHPTIKGFFIAEGDLCLHTEYNFDKFIKENHKTPVWLGYKKILKTNGKIHYVVGNFLLYFPIEYFDKLKQEFNDQKQFVYSDRFFTKLVNKGFLKLNNRTVATEIEHFSNVAKKVRKSSTDSFPCHLSL